MSSVPASLAVASAGRYSQRAWRIGGAVVIVLAAVFLLYRPSSDSLMQLWSDTGKTTYTHGFIIAGLVAWLAFRRRDLLADIPWSPSIPASLLVLAAGFAWMVAVRGGIEIVHQMLLLTLLWLAVWALFGLRMARQLWIPIGYLIFAIPVWDLIIFQLQEATVFVVALLLKISSIPAYVDGNTVHLAAGVFEVEGGCSGVHFLMVSLALSTLYGEIGRDTWNVRLKLIALAVALALLTNWLRVYIIIVAGYLTNMQHYLIRKEHYNFGWMVFAVMMVVFFLLARRFKIHERAPVAVAPPASAGNGRSLGLAVAVACVIATPAWAFLRSVNPAQLPPPVSLTTHTPPGWSQGAESATPDWNPVFVGTDNVIRAIYQNPIGRRVQVYLASYAVQAQGKELVSYGNSLIGPADGSIESSSRATSGEVARELVVQSPAGRAVIRYYYLIGGHVTDRGIVAQVWYGLSALRRETAASVFAMRAACLPDCDAARTLLGEFSGNPEKN